jgi:hypothetical protein
MKLTNRMEQVLLLYANCVKLMHILKVISARTFACFISVIEDGMSVKYTLNEVCFNCTSKPLLLMKLELNSPVNKTDVHHIKMVTRNKIYTTII